MMMVMKTEMCTF